MDLFGKMLLDWHRRDARGPKARKVKDGGEREFDRTMYRRLLNANVKEASLKRSAGDLSGQTPSWALAVRLLGLAGTFNAKDEVVPEIGGGGVK